MLGGIQPYTAMVHGKAGALDDLMTRTQALCLRLPWHRNVAYSDPRVLGMRVPSRCLTNRHSLAGPAASFAHDFNIFRTNATDDARFWWYFL